MRAKRILNNAIDYDSFSDPYTGLATMIFVQAAFDLHYLDGRDHAYNNSSMISKWEILNFLRSGWAEQLAEFVKLDKENIKAFEQAIYG